MSPIHKSPTEQGQQQLWNALRSAVISARTGSPIDRVSRAMVLPIAYDKWKELNYDQEILKQLHQNILNRHQPALNYAHSYAENLRHRSTVNRE